MAYQANRGNSNSDSKRAAQDQKNAEMVKTAADVAQHSANPYAKAAGTAVKVGDKLTGGKVSQKLYDTITGIQTGKVEDKFGWVVEV